MDIISGSLTKFMKLIRRQRPYDAITGAYHGSSERATSLYTKKSS